jgi:hypothetical protein
VPKDVRHWHGGLKNVLAGVTTVAHHDPWHSVFDDPDFPVGVVREFGWCHSLKLGEPGVESRRYGPPVRESFLTTAGAQPWFIHLAEGTDSVACAELGMLDTLGCLAENTVLVHGVGLSSNDIDRILERGVSVVWCPSSNVELFGTTLNARRVFEGGRLTLGSDSRLTGSRDLLDEMRVAAAYSDLSARELLCLVTAGASRVVRRTECGSLEEGCLADCVILRDDADPYDALLHTSRADLRAVVRGGKPVIADPDFAEWFASCDVPAVPARLDGRAKLLARHLARPKVIDLEPGLELA